MPPPFWAHQFVFCMRGDYFYFTHNDTASFAFVVHITINFLQTEAVSKLLSLCFQFLDFIEDVLRNERGIFFRPQVMRIGKNIGQCLLSPRRFVLRGGKSHPFEDALDFRKAFAFSVIFIYELYTGSLSLVDNDLIPVTVVPESDSFFVRMPDS